MENNFKQRILEYTAIFEPAEEGGFIVSIPALPGCTTQGDTFEDAQRNVQDVIHEYLEILNEQGEVIPHENQGSVVTKISITNPLYKG